MHDGLKQFLAAREFLLRAPSYEEMRRSFRWPDPVQFNWALDYFDEFARGNQAPALIMEDESGAETICGFDELRRRSNAMANYFKEQGLAKNDCLLLMMNNSLELFLALLAAIKIGAVVSPASVQLTPADIRDRMSRAKVRAVAAEASLLDETGELADVLRRAPLRFVNGGQRSGWLPLQHAGNCSERFDNPLPTFSTDPCLLYFTSGATAQPKMVLHSHVSYPVGHLVTMAWIGVRPGDLHYNISAPGWGKHAWSSFFAPWNAGATVCLRQYARFDARRTLEFIARRKITTLCAPPSAWRRFLLEDMSAYHFSLREIVSAGEPLNPAIINRVRQSTGITIREGYGQTETVLQIGAFPNMPGRAGAMGLAAPGFDVAVVGPDLLPAPPGVEGQIALRVSAARPLGLMKGYRCAREREDDVFVGGWYLTGDMAVCDQDGYFHFVGRNDDVFKCSDYRISPFEIESILLEHPAVVEAAVVASRDDVRNGFVPKAFLALRPGCETTAAMALDIFRFCRLRMALYKRPRRLQFMPELVKTTSGKLRRVELREHDERLRQHNRRGDLEFMESDFAAELHAGPAPEGGAAG